jgi:hypothetical protein
MKMKLLCAALAGAMVLASCETTSGGYGGGPPRTQLSQCTRNALIGAGVGALVGATQGPARKSRGERSAWRGGWRPRHVWRLPLADGA